MRERLGCFVGERLSQGGDEAGWVAGESHEFR